MAISNNTVMVTYKLSVLIREYSHCYGCYSNYSQTEKLKTIFTLLYKTTIWTDSARRAHLCPAPCGGQWELAEARNTWGLSHSRVWPVTLVKQSAGGWNSWGSSGLSPSLCGLSGMIASEELDFLHLFQFRDPKCMREGKRATGRSSIVYSNLVSEGTQYHPCCILSVRSQSLMVAHVQERELDPLPVKEMTKK